MGCGRVRGCRSTDSLTRRQAPRAAQTHALLPPPGTCRKGWNRLCVPAVRFRPPAPPTRAARDPAALLPRIQGPPGPPRLLPEAWRVAARRRGLDAWHQQRHPGGGTEVSDRPRRCGGESAPSAVRGRAWGRARGGGGSACPPQVRTLVAEPVRPRRVAAAAGEWRVGVARGRRPGTLIVTGWRAVLSHRDPRGGGGGGARPWRGECAAPGRAPDQALRALQASGLRL